MADKSDKKSDFDILETTFEGGVEVTLDSSKEIDAVLDDLESLLKNGDVIGSLTNKGVNASIALLAIHGLRAYLTGQKADAAEDFGTVAEEIAGRLAARKGPEA